ncbi:fimbria/pilus periplasmic chaperone [Wohlfahrtiimonas larvae]|uniref:Fimbria/pilus periplasmic chaperone n=2 Tax=Wohlfahrtiimonas larvae TaxID=1157986 RepID=A0ABP9MYN6_9GAMM
MFRFRRYFQGLMLGLCCASLITFSWAQLTFDRTRVIFDQSQNQSSSLVVENTNTERPFLAHAWITDLAGNKIQEPLVALPFLQRLEAQQAKQIKVSMVGNKNLLPQDRESLLLLHILGVPSGTSSDYSQVTIVISTDMKIFFRPKGLKKYSGTQDWVKNLKVKPSGDTLTLENPTQYHIVIYGYNMTGADDMVQKDIIVKPLSSETMTIKVKDKISIFYILDSGEVEKLTFRCKKNTCQLEES